MALSEHPADMSSHGISTPLTSGSGLAGPSHTTQAAQAIPGLPPGTDSSSFTAEELAIYERATSHIRKCYKTLSRKQRRVLAAQSAVIHLQKERLELILAKSKRMRKKEKLVRDNLVRGCGRRRRQERRNGTARARLMCHKVRLQHTKKQRMQKQEECDTVDLLLKRAMRMLERAMVEFRRADMETNLLRRLIDRRCGLP